MLQHQIKHLKQFFTNNHTHFRQAEKLPQFFQTNLVDDYRIVKYFQNDPQANLRIFYYQYLKLCFQIDNVDFQSYIQKIYQLIRTEDFQFYFEPSDANREFKNRQYKSIMVDFFQLMNTGAHSVDFVINHYPIIDQVFTNFFRTVVMLASVTQSFNGYIQKTQLFDFLSSFFSVDISSYDRCLKFVQSDIFVYEEDQQHIYMAFIKDQEQQIQNQQRENYNRQQNQNYNNILESKLDTQVDYFKNQTYEIKINKQVQSIKNIQNFHQPKQNNDFNSSKPRVRAIIKQSYIEAQFADYTHTNTNLKLQSFGKPILQSMERNQQKHTQSLLDRITANQTNSQINTHQNDEYNFHKALDKTQHQKTKELKRVLSTNNTRTIQNNSRDNIGINIQNNKSNLIKDYSHPNLLDNRDKKSDSDHVKYNLSSFAPTKDPGFVKLNNLSNPQKDSYTSDLTGRSAASYQSNQQKINNFKKSQELFHKPPIQSPTFIGITNYSKQNYEKQKQIVLPSAMKKLKLQVTKEFSNSFVQSCMKQPYKSSVNQMRQRARQYRKNILEGINAVSNYSNFNKEENYQVFNSKFDFKQKPMTQSKTDQNYNYIDNKKNDNFNFISSRGEVNSNYISNKSENSQSNFYKNTDNFGFDSIYDKPQSRKKFNQVNDDKTIMDKNLSNLNYMAGGSINPIKSQYNNIPVYQATNLNIANNSMSPRSQNLNNQEYSKNNYSSGKYQIYQ